MADQSKFMPPMCFPAPLILQPLLVNDGGQPWFAQVGGIYFVGYRSNPENTDIIGNYSFDGKVWFPAIPNTDPPSHFLYVTKDFPSDCAFYPAFDQYGTLFGLAWLETQPTGRLDLKYVDTNQSVSGTPTGPLPSGNPTGASDRVQSTFYVFPRITKVEATERTENMPLSDITVIDTHDNFFKIDLNEAIHRGLELSLDYPIKAFRFTQKFRQLSNHVVGTLTTIPTQDNGFTTNPLPAVGINIYRGHQVNYLLARLITDEKGFFSIDLPNQEFTFEIETQNLSINVNQRIL